VALGQLIVMTSEMDDGLGLAAQPAKIAFTRWASKRLSDTSCELTAS
jgi:hypothetical protein